MRYGIFSDVHGNLEALEVVVRWMRQKTHPHVSLKAAIHVIEQGQGKALQRIDHSVDGDGVSTITVQFVKPESDG